MRQGERVIAHIVVSIEEKYNNVWRKCAHFIFIQETLLHRAHAANAKIQHVMPEFFFQKATHDIGVVHLCRLDNRITQKRDAFSLFFNRPLRIAHAKTIRGKYRVARARIPIFDPKIFPEDHPDPVFIAVLQASRVLKSRRNDAQKKLCHDESYTRERDQSNDKPKEHTRYLCLAIAMNAAVRCVTSSAKKRRSNSGDKRRSNSKDTAPRRAMVVPPPS